MLSDDQGRASDLVLLRLRELIHERFKFDPKTDAVKDAIFLLANRDKFNPVRDYLDALEWDGVPRIDTWLTTYGGADVTPFVRAVGAIPADRHGAPGPTTWLQVRRNSSFGRGTED